MRNEMAMYALKPVVSLPDTLYHSETMYKMQNIHEERSRDDDHTEAENEIVPDITEQVINFLKVSIISVLMPAWKRALTLIILESNRFFTYTFNVHGSYEPFFCLELVVHDSSQNFHKH